MSYKSVKEEANQNLWYLDTGCRSHMCAAFSELDESFRDSVKFGDNSKVALMGKGKITIQTRENSFQNITDVVFVPNLKTRLLSIGQFARERV